MCYWHLLFVHTIDTSPDGVDLGERADELEHSGDAVPSAQADEDVRHSHDVLCARRDEGQRLHDTCF